MKKMKEEVLKKIKDTIKYVTSSDIEIKHLEQYEDVDLNSGETHKLDIYFISGEVIKTYPEFAHVLLFVADDGVEISFIHDHTGFSIPLASMTDEEKEDCKDSIRSIEIERFTHDDILAVINYFQKSDRF